MAIKKLQNDFTTPEQSKRLLELGVPADSANCYYGLDDELHLISGKIPHFLLWRNDCTPCWSVGRLIEIFLMCGAYKELIFDNTRSLLSQIIDMFEATCDDGLIDFSKLEE